MKFIFGTLVHSGYKEDANSKQTNIYMKTLK